MGVHQILARATASKIINVSMRSSSTGQLLTGLTYSALTIYYLREGFAPVAITPVAGTIGTWVSGGWVETTRTGWYQFSVPTNAIASGVWSVDLDFRASGALDKTVNIQLSAVNLNDGGRMGMTALPAVAIGSAGALPTVDASNYIAGVQGDTKQTGDTFIGISTLLGYITAAPPTAAAIATSIWGATTRTLSAFGFTVNTNANATETSIKTKTDLIPSVPATEANVTAVANALSALPTRADASADKDEILSAFDALNLGDAPGARTLMFHVVDSLGSPVERAIVRVTSGLNNKRQMTDNNGIAGIAVSDGTWAYAVDKSGYDGHIGVLSDVASDLAVPIALNAIVLPLPASPDLVMVYGSYGFLGVFDAGVNVTATMRGNGPVFLDGTLQNTDHGAFTVTDEGGLWSLNLAPLPEDFFWELAVGAKKLKVLVPDAIGTAVNVETIMMD